MKKNEVNERKDLSVGQYLIIFVIIGVAFILLNRNNLDRGDVQGVVMTENGVKRVYSTDFEIIKEETTATRNDDGTYIINGKIKQNIADSYTGIFVTIALLDKNGEKVRETTGLQSSEYLGNNIWEFTVYGNDEDNIVTDYKLESCYGY